MKNFSKKSMAVELLSAKILSESLCRDKLALVEKISQGITEYDIRELARVVRAEKENTAKILKLESVLSRGGILSLDTLKADIPATQIRVEPFLASMSLAGLVIATTFISSVINLFV